MKSITTNPQIHLSIQCDVFNFVAEYASQQWHTQYILNYTISLSSFIPRLRPTDFEVRSGWRAFRSAKTPRSTLRPHPSAHWPSSPRPIILWLDTEAATPALSKRKQQQQQTASVEQHVHHVQKDPAEGNGSCWSERYITIELMVE